MTEYTIVKVRLRPIRDNRHEYVVVWYGADGQKQTAAFSKMEYARGFIRNKKTMEGKR